MLHLLPTASIAEHCSSMHVLVDDLYLILGCTHGQQKYSVCEIRGLYQTI